MSDINVPIVIFPSRAEYTTRDLEDEPRVKGIVQAQVLAPSTKEYMRVNVKVKRQPDQTPSHLIVYLLRKDTYTAEVVRVDLTPAFSATNITQDYQETEADADEEEETQQARAAPVAGFDFDSGYEFIAGTPVPEIDTAKAAVEALVELAKAAGFRARTLLGAEASVANYRMYLTAGLAGFVNVGHGNTSSIILSDGTLSAAWLNGPPVQSLKPEVAYFNSCQTFNPPLQPAMMNAKARTYIAGIVNLLIGPSEEVCKAFWRAIITSMVRMEDALHQAEKDHYPTTGAHGISGDTGSFRRMAFSNKVVLRDMSPVTPALASVNRALYLGWKGSGNNNLNVMPSTDGGRTFSHKYISPETSPESPALCAHGGGLYISWKGNGNNYLNVARVDLQGSTPVGFSRKVVLRDTSPVTPALASLNGVLYLAWKGDGNNQLNIVASTDNGATFGHKYVSPERSPESPALCAHKGMLYIGWKGDGNNYLNVARVALQGGYPVGVSKKVVLRETSPLFPTLASANGQLYLGWRGLGNYYLNVMSSIDDGASFGNKYTPPETSAESPGLCAHGNQLYVTWKGYGNDYLNVAVFTLTIPVFAAGVSAPTQAEPLAERAPAEPELVGAQT